MPLHLRPLPPLPGSPSLQHGKLTKSINPLASLKQSEGFNRLLRPKRASSSSRPSTASQHQTPYLGHRSSPPTFSEPQSPLDSHPPSSPRPRLAAREEPHASLPPRPSFESSFGIDRAKSRKHGMTALSFLALDDPSLTYHGSRANTESTSNRNGLDMNLGRRRGSVQAHIIPPEELAKLCHRRRSSSISESGVTQTSEMMVKDQGEIESMDDHRQSRPVARMSFGLSPPPPPRHNRRSFEPPARVDEDDDPIPLSLSPPPRPRNSLNARRPTPSPVHIDTSLAPPYGHDSYLDISPSPSPMNPTPVTPSDHRRGSATSRAGLRVGYRESRSPPREEFSQYNISLIGHASKLGRGHIYQQEVTSEPSGQEREAERQALNDWLAMPRSRKASIPVIGISRIRAGVYV